MLLGKDLVSLQKTTPTIPNPSQTQHLYIDAVSIKVLC